MEDQCLDVDRGKAASCEVGEGHGKSSLRGAVNESKLWAVRRSPRATKLTGAPMNSHSFFSRHFPSAVFRLAAIALVALSASSLAFCGEIHDASSQGDLGQVRLLLQNDPSLVFSRENGWTPLHFAALTGQRDMAELLLMNQAKVNAVDKRGWTPLHVAAERGYRDAAAVLVANGAVVDARDKQGWTPLHWAASGNRIDVAVLLLASQADVNAKDAQGNTPIYYAQQGLHKEMVKLLRQHGARGAAVSKVTDEPEEMNVCSGGETDCEHPPP